MTVSSNPWDVDILLLIFVTVFTRRASYSTLIVNAALSWIDSIALEKAVFEVWSYIISPFSRCGLMKDLQIVSRLERGTKHYNLQRNLCKPRI